jgi:FkbM family methyltransferase
VDAASFLSMYREIFYRGVYAFKTDSSPPRILDCGANVGLSVLYWKQRFPNARITAFEPDPDVFEVLAWNCERHAHDDITLVRKGVWKREGDLTFYQQGADGGFLEDPDSTSIPEEQLTTVPVVRLRNYLDEAVDLLKIDIEGAEVDVLLDCEGALDQVERLFVEYHSFVGKPQRIDELLRVLRDADFRLHIQPELVATRPFVDQIENSSTEHGHMDHRLNIFAYRQ